MDKKGFINDIIEEINIIENEPFDSQEETNGYINALKIVLIKAERLYEPPTEPCDYCAQHPTYVTAMRLKAN